ncbi:MAG TPA: cysteine--tRNA ligase [Candidatus Thermoplasmatota archaeon]|nr:cysteine--tRNA ligase [Candidatus Thermoplasmatota archaeon]
MAREHPVVVENSLTGKKERLVPLDGQRLRMYVCGLTVYDRVHIGHARTYSSFDTIRRYLQHRGYSVVHVQNVTDVDDKIIARAHETGDDAILLADRMNRLAEADLARLRVLPPHVTPKVTEHIPQIIALIETLIAKGHAYASQGNVYFSVPSFPAYGALTHPNREQLLEGVRKDVAEGKRDAEDFALWKAAKPGEVWWDSPWGRGRPGWHIECSAMARSLLGDTFDVHGGGMDLKFPHHENEIAQSEAATGKPLVKYWLHCGFLNVQGEKMSKSLGNFITLHEALDRDPPEVLRFLFAQTHYRSRIDYSDANLAQARGQIERFRTMLENVAHAKDKGAKEDAEEQALLAHVKEARAGFERAMDNDFDTPGALAQLLEVASLLNKLAAKPASRQGLERAELAFRTLAGILGALPSKAEATSGGNEPALLDLLLQVRQEARKAKQFAISDKVRDGLAALGYVIEDTAEGPRWRRR